jgi:hypothetical protein
LYVDHSRWSRDGSAGLEEGESSGLADDTGREETPSKPAKESPERRLFGCHNSPPISLSCA